ncbi:MAG TPA: hydrogenase expression/formation protein HypE [Phycisphaerales bacterium]|nr:hydrogenase expression/formation protein HypE [Phycisphaerales bacterium]
MNRERIQLAHGGGGQLSAELIAEVILPILGSQRPGRLTDAACLSVDAGRLAFTTDSYVVQPLEFPGGDIGKLAVCGTINDLAVAGAQPRALSLSLVLQEGLAISTLRKVLTSAAGAARDAGVEIVTGDTKVVGREGCDGMIVNTAGVGVVAEGAELGFERVEQGDCILLSGALGEHGLSVVSCRKGLSFATDLRSDCAALHELTGSLLASLGGNVHFMRDPTRGGLAATLAELAAAIGRDVEIQEEAIPVNPVARSAAEMLGLDLLTVANEGKLVAVVAARQAPRALEILRSHRLGAKAAIIGTVGEAASGPLVEMQTVVGGRRIVQMPYGEELPRIC